MCTLLSLPTTSFLTYIFTKSILQMSYNSLSTYQVIGISFQSHYRHATSYCPYNKTAVGAVGEQSTPLQELSTSVVHTKLHVDLN
jgi:uncharacterized Ntn-hydrolase superfamily protein